MNYKYKVYGYAGPKKDRVQLASGTFHHAPQVEPFELVSKLHETYDSMWKDIETIEVEVTVTEIYCG